MRGPGILPSSIAWRRPTSFQASEPTLRTVVKPACSVLLRVRHGEHRPEAVVELQAGVAAVRRIAVEVHVHVDQAGQQGHAGQIEAPRRGRDLNLGSRSRRGDAAIADDHDRLLDDFARRDVDQPIGADRDDLGIHGGGPGEGGQQQGCEHKVTHRSFR